MPRERTARRERRERERRERERGTGERRHEERRDLAQLAGLGLALVWYASFGRFVDEAV